MGLFGISWKELWQKSGLDKLGWLNAVKAARGSSHLHRTARANDQHDHRILALARDVDSIGFLNISWGSLPTAWSSHQDEFYRDIVSWCSGHT